MHGNGHRPGGLLLPGRLYAMLRSSAAFEWAEGVSLSPRLWIVLGAILAVPIPMFGWPLPERAAPIFYILMAGFLCALARIARASWPFAVLILYASLRAAYGNFPLRTLQLLALLLMAGFLYVAAREMSDGVARMVAWAIVGTAGFEMALGLMNSFGYYPWMAWVSPEHAGKPMGFLTHPNYWGSFIALCLPIIWSRVGLLGVLLAWGLILKTISGGPVISAAVGSLVMVWPFFTRRVRYAVAAFGGAAIAVTMTMHEWRLSGRREVWLTSWPEATKNLRGILAGMGLGEWRSWADEYNSAHWAPQKGHAFFVTLQAHNEPYQLWFELGLIGLLIGACLALQAYLSCRTIWNAAPASILSGPWWAFGRVPLERAWIAVLVVAAVNMFGSPVFHLPGQATIILFALARAQADASALSAVPPIIAKPVRRRRKKAKQNDVDPSVASAFGGAA